MFVALTYTNTQSDTHDTKQIFRFFVIVLIFLALIFRFYYFFGKMRNKFPQIAGVAGKIANGCERNRKRLTKKHTAVKKGLLNVFHTMRF